jgi:DNA-binding MarR family transcriptional regulator
VGSVVPDDDLLDRMARCWRELRRGPATVIVRDRLFGTGDDCVDPAHVDVLDLLVVRDGWRMNELASALNVDPSTVTRTLQRMELAGLAVRTPHDSDGRVVTVFITAAGRECQRVVRARRKETIANILAGFDPGDRQQLVHLVELFIAAAYDYVGLRQTFGSSASAAG